MANGFRYQRLLDVKDILLQQEAVALREMRENRAAQKQLLEGIQQQKSEHLSAGYGPEIKRGEVVLPLHLQTQVWYTQQLNENMQKQIHELQSAAEQAEHQRQAVEEATVEKKSLELLKEKQLEQERLTVAREEQKVFDEIASRRFIMSSRVE